MRPEPRIILSIVSTFCAGCLFFSPLAQFAFDLFFHLLTDLFPLVVLFVFLVEPALDPLADLGFHFGADLLPFLFLALDGDSFLAARSRSASKEDGRPKEETEVIPVAGVIYLIQADVVGEEADDEGEHTDKPVPEPGPESCRFLVKARVAGGAADCGQDQDDQRGADNRFMLEFHFSLLVPSVILCLMQMVLQLSIPFLLIPQGLPPILLWIP